MGDPERHREGSCSLLADHPIHRPLACRHGRPILYRSIDEAATTHQAFRIAARRHLHGHPELSNQDAKTAADVADHLRAMGLELRTETACYGVIGSFVEANLRSGWWLFMPTGISCP